LICDVIARGLTDTKVWLSIVQFPWLLASGVIAALKINPSAAIGEVQVNEAAEYLYRSGNAFPVAAPTAASGELSGCYACFRGGGSRILISHFSGVIYV
jgi:hypothetical protein